MPYQNPLSVNTASIIIDLNLFAENRGFQCWGTDCTIAPINLDVHRFSGKIRKIKNNYDR